MDFVEKKEKQSEVLSTMKPCQCSLASMRDDHRSLPTCMATVLLLLFFFTKNHTPFDGTKQQGSDETYGMAGVGERQGQLDRP